jgi:hypothetical protein
MRYSYLQVVSSGTSFILLHGILDYGKHGLQTRSDRVRKIPASEPDLALETRARETEDR